MCRAYRPKTFSNTLNAPVQCIQMHLQQTSEVVPAKIRISQAVRWRVPKRRAGHRGGPWTDRHDRPIEKASLNIKVNSGTKWNLEREQRRTRGLWQVEALPSPTRWPSWASPDPAHPRRPSACSRRRGGSAEVLQWGAAKRTPRRPARRTGVDPRRETSASRVESSTGQPQTAAFLHKVYKSCYREMNSFTFQSPVLQLCFQWPWPYGAL